MPEELLLLTSSYFDSRMICTLEKLSCWFKERIGAVWYEFQSLNGLQADGCSSREIFRKFHKYYATQAYATYLGKIGPLPKIPQSIVDAASKSDYRLLFVPHEINGTQLTLNHLFKIPYVRLLAGKSHDLIMAEHGQSPVSESHWVYMKIDGEDSTDQKVVSLIERILFCIFYFLEEGKESIEQRTSTLVNVLGVKLESGCGVSISAGLHLFHCEKQSLVKCARGI
jgi:hypothetical protein